MNSHSDTPFHARHDDDLLTLEEASEVLGISINTLRWWRQKGEGPAYFKIGRRLYITAGEVRAFIRQQRIAVRPVLRSPRKLG